MEKVYGINQKALKAQPGYVDEEGVMQVDKQCRTVLEQDLMELIEFAPIVSRRLEMATKARHLDPGFLKKVATRMEWAAQRHGEWKNIDLLLAAEEELLDWWVYITKYEADQARVVLHT
jgi:hypothetical protein